MIGQAANLRRWAAAQLGALPPRRAAKRPPTNLRPIAESLLFLETSSGFHQRLAFERAMGPLVPLAKRRDLKRPAFLHLDPKQRFPRSFVRDAAGPDGFGPFRDRDSAARAREALHKLFPLRPCDFDFEPDPGLALGLGCVHAQVRSCAAPCLARTGEPDYRALAAEAAAFLASPLLRAARGSNALPDWVAAASGARGVVVDRGLHGIELYPVRAGSVLESARSLASEAELGPALSRLRFDGGDPGRDDTPWLLDWLRRKKKTGGYVVIEAGDDSGLARRLLAAVPSLRRETSRLPRDGAPGGP